MNEILLEKYKEREKKIKEIDHFPSVKMHKKTDDNIISYNNQEILETKKRIGINNMQQFYFTDSKSTSHQHCTIDFPFF